MKKLLLIMLLAANVNAAEKCTSKDYIIVDDPLEKTVTKVYGIKIVDYNDKKQDKEQFKDLEPIKIGSWTCYKKRQVKKQ